MRPYCQCELVDCACVTECLSVPLCMCAFQLAWECASAYLAWECASAYLAWECACAYLTWECATYLVWGDGMFVLCSSVREGVWGGCTFDV